MNDSYTEFDKLLKGFIEESLSSEEQLEFEKILKTDSLARQRYLDYLAVDSMLANHQVEIEDFRKTSKKKVRFDSQRTKQLNRKRKKTIENSSVINGSLSVFGIKSWVLFKAA